MNGAHDLGGMHGFGPIDPESESEEPVFHAEWERRVFALTLAAGFLGKWSLDQTRHARERQHPADYLRHSYYENWLAGLETLLVESALVSEQELHRGRATRRLGEADGIRVLEARQVQRALARGGPTTMDIPLEPKYRVGDGVRVRNINPAGHTRAPRYIRGKTGVVAADHGVHVFADKNAHGVREGQRLYGVRFSARELWGPEASARDAVYVDLWDAHLEPG
ncbi:MAG: nitrile hydratase subunit beta [Gammaproteobacteria bacterium]|nr:nitrile hydratase subunit beta [Gammaproteobacteria bacterium]